MSSRTLNNKPLVEAIFELRWRVAKPPEFPVATDPYYGLLLGRFSAKVEEDYPFHEPLNPAVLPDVMLPAYVVQHRFRSREGGWPVVQIGPGIMTVNDTTSYTWGDFRPRCVKALENLMAAYPRDATLSLDSLTLRYIDAVDIDHTSKSIFSFLEEKMRTTVKLPPDLFENQNIKQIPRTFNLEVSYPHSTLGSVTVRFGIGVKGTKPAFLWETFAQTNGGLLIPKKVPQWLDSAHEFTDDWFFKLIKGDLEKEFA